MNLQIGQMNTVVKRKRNNVRTRKKRNLSFLSVAKIVLPLSVIFGLAVTMTLFNSETEKLNRRISKTKYEIHVFDRAIAELNIKNEQLKGRFILKQVAYFKLDLQTPRLGQVREINLKKSVSGKRRPVSFSESLLISQR